MYLNWNYLYLLIWKNEPIFIHIIVYSFLKYERIYILFFFFFFKYKSYALIIDIII